MDIQREWLIFRLHSGSMKTKAKNLTKIMVLLFAVIIIHCDTQKKNSIDMLQSQLFCELAAICPKGAGAKFGMVGDSWTDLFLGFDYVRTLRQQLEQDYGYNIIGATLGGTTMEDITIRNSHIQVIETAGPDIKYMLLSLG